MNPNGTLSRLFASTRSSPPDDDEIAQIKQLQCEQLMKEFGSQISEDVIRMYLDDAYDAYAKSGRDPLETTRIYLAEWIAEQNFTVQLAGPSNDHGQPSASLTGPTRLDTPPFQPANPWNFHDWNYNNSPFPGVGTGFAPGLDCERVPAGSRSNPVNGGHDKPVLTACAVRSKSESPATTEEDDFYVVDQEDVKLQRLEKDTELFIKNAEAKKQENEQLKERFRELYSKCQDPMLTEYMNLVDTEEKLDRNIRSLQEILKSMGVSSEHSDNVQSGK